MQVEPLVEVRRDKLLRDEPLGQLSLSTYELVCAALGSVDPTIPYQNLINLYLVQCAEEKKVLAFA